MKNIVAYCRTAWASQSDPLSGVRLQQKALRRYAKRRGFAIHETYMDAGVSGITLNRLALQKLLAECRAGKIGTVITQDPERLSRDMGQLYTLLCVFLKAGVSVEFRSRARPLSDAFLKTVVSAVAELEKAKVRSKRKRRPSPLIAGA